MGFRAWDLWFGELGSGLGNWDQVWGFRIYPHLRDVLLAIQRVQQRVVQKPEGLWGLGYRVWGLGSWFKVQGLAVRI